MNADDGIIRKLYKNEKLNVEQEFAKDVHYEGITGSTAYGMNNSDTSDTDVVAICIPPLEWVFPHVSGAVPGFGPNPPKFDVTQQHHIMLNDKEYDIAIYSIVKFFQLAAENNPNIIDVLFLPDRCITHMDNIGKLIRQNRKLFLTRHAFHKYIGYSYSQLKKIESKNPKESRMDLVEKYGFDTKYASHLIRLALQCEQILIEHDLNLERNSEILKSVRRGEWSLDQIKTWFKEKELNLNSIYADSKLRYSPDWEELKRILLCCLEEKFGSMSAYINTNVDSRILRKYEQIKQIIES